MRDRSDRAATTLGRLDPARSALRRRLGVLEHGVTTVARLVRAGPFFFFLRHGPHDRSAVLCMRGVDGSGERVVIDPRPDLPRGVRSRDGGPATIGRFLPSRDGRFVAYTVWTQDPSAAELHVLDTNTLTDLPERISDVRDSGVTSWFDDARSFAYDRYPPLLARHDARDERRYAMALRHVVGRSPNQDTPIFGRGVDSAIDFGPDDVPIVRIAPGAPFAAGLIRHGVSRDLTVYLAPAAALAGSTSAWRFVAGPADGVVDVALTASTLFLLDHKNGGGFEIRAVPAAAPDLATATTIVPASADVIDGLSVARDALYVAARRGAAGKLLRVPLGVDGVYRGTSQTLALPAAGVVTAFANDAEAIGAVATVSSWLEPSRTFVFGPGDAAVDLRLGGGNGSPGSRLVDEEFARSADGTLVPVSIIHDARLPHDGRRPTLLEVFGAYGETTFPSYDSAREAWLERGGAYAVCHARGGGWFGDVWHKAATADRKRLTADDVLACANHVVERGYTSPAHLAIVASGAGGLALGGAIVRSPGLFAAAIALDAIADPIREQFAASGPANAPEFGTSDTPAGIAGLLAMSPYAHLSDLTTYPAALLASGSGENGVPPWQTAKFAARYETAQSARRPVLFRSNEDPADLTADALSFALWQTGDAGFAFVPLDGRVPMGTAASHSKRTFSRSTPPRP